jgi:hypothetical protein
VSASAREIASERGGGSGTPTVAAYVEERAGRRISRAAARFDDDLHRAFLGP